MHTPLARRALTWLVTIAFMVGIVGCETPVNDSHLPPSETPEIEDEADAQGADTAAQPEEVSALSEPDIMALEEVESGDSGDAEAAGSLIDVDGACEADEVCLAYWLAYSACLVQVGGPSAAVDPEEYADTCASGCALEHRLDYVSHYACLAAGIPADCSEEDMRFPSCPLD